MKYLYMDEQERQIQYYQFPKFLLELPLLNVYELLIIDDLGVERNSEYALENIFSVIDWRYRSGKPLIITTNLPLAQLKQEIKIEKKRIYDRILERCIPVKIDGVSRRETMVNDNMQTMKNILKI